MSYLKLDRPNSASLRPQYSVLCRPKPDPYPTARKVGRQDCRSKLQLAETQG